MQWNPFNDVNLLSKFNVFSLFMTGDNIENWSFCCEQFKDDFQLANFGQVKTDPIWSHLFNDFGQAIFIEFG